MRAYSDDETTRKVKERALEYLRHIYEQINTNEVIPQEVNIFYGTEEYPDDNGFVAVKNNGEIDLTISLYSEELDYRRRSTMPRISIVYSEKDLKQLVLEDLADKMPGESFKTTDLDILVKSAQNYSAEWETAKFKCEVNKY